MDTDETPVDSQMAQMILDSERRKYAPNVVGEAFKYPLLSEYNMESMQETEAQRRFNSVQRRVIETLSEIKDEVKEGNTGSASDLIAALMAEIQKWGIVNMWGDDLDPSLKRIF